MADVVKEGNTILLKVNEIKVSGNENGYVVVEVGSGTYHFTAPYNKGNESAMK